MTFSYEYFLMKNISLSMTKITIIYIPVYMNNKIDTILVTMWIKPKKALFLYYSDIFWEENVVMLLLRWVICARASCVYLNYMKRQVIWEQGLHYCKFPLNSLVYYPQSSWNTAYLINPWTTGNIWVLMKHCGYRWPGAKAPGHQYPQCQLNIHCSGPILYKNVSI